MTSPPDMAQLDESNDAYRAPRSALLPPLTPQSAIAGASWIIPTLVVAAIFAAGWFVGVVSAASVALGWWN